MARSKQYYQQSHLHFHWQWSKLYSGKMFLSSVRQFQVLIQNSVKNLILCTLFIFFENVLLALQSSITGHSHFSTLLGYYIAWFELSKTKYSNTRMSTTTRQLRNTGYIYTVHFVLLAAFYWRYTELLETHFV